MSLSQHILSVLGESPLPVATPDLVAICGEGRSNARSQVWAALVELRRNGLVKTLPHRIRNRLSGQGGNQLVTLWVLS